MPVVEDLEVMELKEPLNSRDTHEHEPSSESAQSAADPLPNQREEPMRFQPSSIPSPIQVREDLNNTFNEEPVGSSLIEAGGDDDIDFQRNQNKRKKKLKKNREVDWNVEDQEI